MTQEELNVVTLTPYYLISHKKLNKPYVDESSTCYMFTKKYSAENFIDIKKDGLLYVTETMTYIMPELNKLYFFGVRYINVDSSDTSYELNIPSVKTQYYLSDTNKYLLLMSVTNKKKYLKEIAKCHFITPVLIIPRNKKEITKLEYINMSTSNLTKYFILFTSLDEYNRWESENGLNTSPYLNVLTKLLLSRKKKRIIINPLSDKIILDYKHIEVIEKC